MSVYVNVDVHLAHICMLHMYMYMHRYRYTFLHLWLHNQDLPEIMVLVATGMWLRKGIGHYPVPDSRRRGVQHMKGGQAASLFESIDWRLREVATALTIEAQLQDT